MLSTLSSRLSPLLSARSRLLSKSRLLSTSAARPGPLAWYMRKLESHPVLTKSLTSGVIAGSGDVFCQLLVHRNARPAAGGAGFALDSRRAARFAFLGLALIGPVSHLWYGFVMRLLPGGGLRVNAQRVLLDQGLFANLFIPTMFTSSKLLEGHSLETAVRDLKASYFDIYTSNLLLWPAAMAFNFSMVPPQFQVLFSNAVGLVWNSYLSFMANDNGKGGGEGEKGEKVAKAKA
ncbi:hypothetical protein TeGR_g14069 [Tetraparma gracilis]|uniref:Uncharacterized protein n=1 Tax=Tetraparma gracilis TaxID=2962635 RepID=A0ABQ6MQY4_9STRA|nr:hypothetical protein TeGR_g14069 [Tetraparma gracilis]